MKITKRIQNIVERANNARFNQAIYFLKSQDKTISEQERIASETFDNVFSGQWTAYVESLMMLGVDIDNDVKLDSWDESLQMAELHLK